MQNSYLGECSSFDPSSVTSSISTRFQLVFSPKACTCLILAQFHYNPNLFPTFSQLVLSSVSVRSQLCLSLAQTLFQVVSSLFTARSQFNPSSIPARVQLVSSFFQLFSARSPARFQLVSSSSPPQSQLHLSLVSALSMESKLIIQPIHYSFTLCLLLSS